MRNIRIALVDDHQIVLDGLQSLLQHCDGIDLLFANTSASQLIDWLKEHTIDVLITDIMMPEMSGTELAIHINQHYPTIKILALSMNGEATIVDELINQANISGYVLKNISQRELITAIQKIASGGIYFSDSILEDLAKLNSHRNRIVQQPKLTNREIEIIQLIEQEFSNKQIAEKLFISERTVETHRKNIFRKTATNSVIGLIKYAYEHKII